MSKYSDREYSNMVRCYEDSGGITLRARSLYISRGYVEEERIPSAGTIQAVVQRLRETGSYRGTRVDAGRCSIYSEGKKRAVIQFYTANPSESIRVAARVLKLNRGYIHRVLKAEKSALSNLSKLQTQLQPDLPARLAFCKWLLQDRSRNILWTDEMTFTSKDCFHMHTENANGRNRPRAMWEGARFRRHVWAGLLNCCVLGPVFLERLSGSCYREFLAGPLEDLLDEAPLADQCALYYQHDGAPAHNSRPVRELLNERYSKRWIGREGPVAWPPHSPDLTPLTFFWGRVKSLAYWNKPEVASAEELERRLRRAFARLRRDPATLRRVRAHTYAAAESCVARGGGNVDPFNYKQ